MKDLYVFTLDSHDTFGPFWFNGEHSSYWHAMKFADQRGLRSFTVIDKPSPYAQVIAPSIPIVLR